MSDSPDPATRDHAPRVQTHYFGDGCQPPHECPAGHSNPLKAHMCGTCGLVYEDNRSWVRGGTSMPDAPSEVEHDYGFGAHGTDD